MNSRRAVWSAAARVLCAVLSLVFASLFAAGCATRGTAADRARAVPAPDPGLVARVFAARLPSLLPAAQPLDEQLAQRALGLFLSSLDEDHTLLLASDVDRFSARAAELIPSLRRGDLSLAREAAALCRGRARERLAYVEGLLDAGLDLAREESYVSRDATAAWSADAREQRGLWRKQAKDMYLRRRVAAVLAGVAETAAAQRARTETRAVYRRLIRMSEFDAAGLLDRYLSACVRAFDSQGDYLSSNELDDMAVALSLSLVGVGAVVSMVDGEARVARILPGGTAARDGRLLPGDRIVAVAERDGPRQSVDGWSVDRIVHAVRGQRGTRVVLSVSPAIGPPGRIVEIELKRDIVRFGGESVNGAVRILSSGAGRDVRLGVVGLESFYSEAAYGSARAARPGGSTHDMRRILKQMREDRVAGVLLDVRGNAGGALPEAVGVAGLFIGQAPVGQVREWRKTIRTVVVEDRDRRCAYAGPVVVLSDRTSGSGAEALAAVLQDYGRALIVGDTRTYGKGTVQSVVPLRRGDWALGGLKVTTAAFYRITGQPLQGYGVRADIVVPSILDRITSARVPVDSPAVATIEPVAGLERSESAGNEFCDVRVFARRLREQSRQRRAEDPRFEAREQRFRALAESRRAERGVSLVYEQRLRAARREQDLYGPLLAGPAETQEPEDDLVLDEALRILADLVAVCEAAAAE